MTNKSLTTVNVGQDIRKDPNGIMPRDIQELRKVFPRQPYTTRLTDREIMFKEGQQSVIDYLASKIT